MLDVVSALASLLALIQATSQVVDYLSDVRDGGRERMRLLAEVSSFCCSLDNLKDLLENGSSSSETSDNTNVESTKGLQQGRLLEKLLDQCHGAISALTKRLAPKEGKAQLIQNLRWSFSKAEVLQMVEQLHRLHTIINNHLSQANILLSRQIRHDGAVSRQILQDHEKREIGDWLSPLDFAAQKEAIFASNCPGTGTQFLESGNYELWKRSDGCVMWCYGVPGAGKTCLASIVVHELQQELDPDAEIVLVVYCRYDDPQRQIVANIAGDLLRQCIRDREMPQALVELFQKFHSSAGSLPPSDALFSILSAQLASFRKAYIVVDALDELTFPDDRKHILEKLRSINKGLSLMLMSRDLEDIRSRMGLMDGLCDCCFDQCHHCDGGCPRYADYLYHCANCIHPEGYGSFDLCQTCYEAGARCLRAEHTMEQKLNCIPYEVVPTEDDLKRYVSWRISADASLKRLMAGRDGLHDQVRDAVLRNSGSMFLMAKLIIDSLATCLTVKELKSALADIPSGLSVAYDATMQRILDQGPKRAGRAFEVIRWVLLAKRPLTSAEAEHAISIEHGSEDIDLDDIVPAMTLASLCAGLVVITDSDGLSFMHKSVPDYLRTYHAEKFLNARPTLGDKCLTYITYKVFAEGPCRDLMALEARGRRYPAYSYCSRYWYEHLEEFMPEEPNQAALNFFQSEPSWRAAAQVTKHYGNIVYQDGFQENDTVLHYAAFLGAYPMFDDLLRLNFSYLNTQDSFGWSPLIQAASDGHVSTVASLLKAGADLKIVNDHGDSALHVAVHHCHLNVVNTLVTAGADLKAVNDQGNTPLHMAAQHGCVNIVTALVTERADLNRTNGNRDTALHMAIKAGHIAVIEAIVDSGMDIDLPRKKVSHSVSPIFLASLLRRVDILAVVIQHSLNIRLRSPFYRKTALQYAIEFGNVDAVKLLLSQKTTEADTADKYGQTPLTCAASIGTAAIISDLVVHGASLNRQTYAGYTPVLLAVKNNYTETTKALLSFPRVDVNAVPPSDGRTALHYAVSWGNAELVALLIAHGADIHLRDKINGFTSLDYARYFNNREILGLVE